jgi:glycosyltransferase involved in cell wall biosynthesis
MVRQLSRQERFDVVHAASPPDMLLTLAMELRHRGAALIFDHHDLSPELFEVKFGRRGIFYWTLRLIERLGFRLSDVVIAPNESFKKIAVDRGRVNSGDVFVVRNGPDPNVFRPTEPDESLRRKAQFLLGYVGVMGRQDGVLEALDALIMLRRMRSDWHAIFIGDGDVLPEARAAVRRHGLADSVTFMGHIDDRTHLVKCIASCDVCLSPEPRNELNEHSTLIKVAEYMSVGKPVAAFDLRETAATLGNTTPRATTLAGFASLIDRLLDDSELRLTLGRAGRERVLTDLGWHRSEEMLLAAYQHALERARARRESRHDRYVTTRG